MLQTIIENSPLFYLTQSLWRDEVFSIFVAQKPLTEFIGKLSFEPPLYYTLLHVWIKIFGTGEIAARSLSLLGFTLATVVVIFWAEKLFHKSWLSWFLPLFFFLNPMLLYYAFEVRTYGWFIFFATWSYYTYINKSWKWYIVATALGFYNHSYFAIIPFVQSLHYLMEERKHLFPMKPKKIIKDPMLRATAVIGLLMAPWLIVIGLAVAKLQNSWYFPVDLNLIKSVLGNMFVGYEGTPWYGWEYTRYLSLFILGLSTFALIKNKDKKVTRFFYLLMIVPLAIVIAISFAKPLFVNRYLIGVTIAQVFLLTLAIAAIKNALLQKTLAAALIALCIYVNIIYPPLHPKMPFRAIINSINAQMNTTDVIYAKTPVILFETQYYAKNPENVFLYNPDSIPFPWYVGDFIVTPEMMRQSFPVYPERAFLLNEDGTFEIIYQHALPLSANL